MKQKRFIFNVFTLTITGLIARTIGIWFQVQMSKTIGAEGIGLFQLIMTVFYFAVTLTASGTTLTVTRLVTDTIASGRQNRIKYIIRICLLLSLLLSIICAALLFFFSDEIGIYFLNDTRTVLSLKILSFCLPFMSVSACLRGYFYAKRKSGKAAMEQLLEQVVEISVFLAIIGQFVSKGLEYACCAIAISMLCSEVISCIFSFVSYKLDARKSSERPIKSKGFLKKAASIFVPATLSSSLRSGLGTIENVLIPSGLRKNGASYESSLAGYGTITGMVMPLITFPSVFLGAFSTLMIPEMSEANATTRKNSIKYMSSRILRFTLLMSVPISVVLFFFADSIGNLVYNDPSVGAFIRVFSAIIPIIYLDLVVDGILKGLNQQSHYLLYNIIDSAMRVVLIFFLLPMYGIRGLIIVMFVSAIFNTSMSLLRLIKVSALTFKPIDWIFKPFLAILLPCVLLAILEFYNLIPAHGSFSILKIIAVLACYFFIMRISKALSKEEITWLKGIVKINR